MRRYTLFSFEALERNYRMRLKKLGDNAGITIATNPMNRGGKKRRILVQNLITSSIKNKKKKRQKNPKLGGRKFCQRGKETEPKAGLTLTWFSKHKSSPCSKATNTIPEPLSASIIHLLLPCCIICAGWRWIRGYIGYMTVYLCEETVCSSTLCHE